MAALVYRVLAVVIAIGIAVLSRPSELLAANAPTSARCGQSDEVVLHNPPRPAIVSRHHAGAMPDDRGELEECAHGDPIEWRGLVLASTLTPITGRSVLRVHVRTSVGPPSRGPPASP